MAGARNFRQKKGRGAMSNSASILEITQLIEPVVRDKDYSLVEVAWGTSFRRRTLTVYIDKPEGVQSNDCQSLAREIGNLLDEKDLIMGSYVLEVSSPGAERPLGTDNDFLHFQGRYALLRTKEPLAEISTSEVYGFLRGLDNGYVLLETEQGQQLQIARDSIVKARLAIKF